MSSPSSSGITPLKFLNDPVVLSKRHLRFGWWTLLFFVVLGLVLEGLHAFKVGGYLGAKNEAGQQFSF